MLDAVGQMDLTAFYAAYRQDGWGRSAYEPGMLVALLLHAYCEGERSSRQIERRCREDIAFRVLAANQVPDHATICRFRRLHEEALAGLFAEVLRLCAEAGLLRVGVVALDGTKLRANASREQNHASAEIDAEVRRILAEAERVDAEEDARFGSERGDELPPGPAASGRAAGSTARCEGTPGGPRARTAGALRRAPPSTSGEGPARAQAGAGGG